MMQKALLLLLPLASAQLCVPYFGNCNSRAPTSEEGTSWLTVLSCTANQVPKLQDGFNTPLYQYLFEVLAKNTHLLPLGVPIKSNSEDFETTMAYEKCLWGMGDVQENTIDGELEPETKVQKSAYEMLFSSREGGYDSVTGFSLLGGKVVAALVGYIVYTLTG